MARLHVIYDRDSILQSTHENMPKEKFKIAIIDIKDNFSLEEIEAYVNLLSVLLLEQIASEV